MGNMRLYSILNLAKYIARTEHCYGEYGLNIQANRTCAEGLFITGYGEYELRQLVNTS